MRPYILAETNWAAVKDQQYNLAVLPWAATEAHNYHLPYSADVIEANRISEGAAGLAWDRGAKIVVLPTIPIGVNTGQRDIKLDLNLNPSTQAIILRDIVDVLDHHGIFKLLIMNSHGGNDFKQMIRELNVQYPGMLLTTCNFWQALKLDEYFDEPGDHAGEMETSLLMYLAPDLVLPLNKAGKGHARKIKIKSFHEGWAWAERKWSKVTEDTGIGNPSKATAEKGKRYFDDLVKKIGDLMYELATTDPEDFYQ
ncbi:MAG: amidase [Bacteroides sp. SM23_62_1]|nr:MAG: amidase [Bacteroides sp. SM23_62_1]